jgi:Protein of unknown function (DUF1493)
MPQVTFEEVKAFTLRELWETPDGLTEQTSLAHDVGIAGLDGKEFIEKYAIRFGVSLEGFDWIVYFGPEGVGIGAPLGLVVFLWRRYVQRIPARTLVGLPELTLGHLVECANNGRWHTPRQTA